MNKQRRKQRRKQLSELEGKLVTIKLDLEQLKDDEQEYFDNMPESLQGGDKGNAAETAISYMDDAINNLDTVIENIMSTQE